MRMRARGVLSLSVFPISAVGLSTRPLRSNAVYLEDTGTTVEGLKFYGTPWTNSSHMVSYDTGLSDIWGQFLPRRNAAYRNDG